MLNDERAKRVALIAGVALFGAIAIVYLLKGTTKAGRVTRAPSVAPYTVTLYEQITKRDGTRVRGHRQVFAVKSDGSSVRAIDTLLSAHGQAVAQREIWLATGQIINVDDVREQMSSRPINPRVVFRRLRDPASNCRDSVAGGPPIAADERRGPPESRYGHQVVPILIGGATFFYALDLSCAPIGHYMGFGGNERSELIPDRIEIGEPNAALFEIPASYKEVPSNMAR